MSGEVSLTRRAVSEAPLTRRAALVAAGAALLARPLVAHARERDPETLRDLLGLEVEAAFAYRAAAAAAPLLARLGEHDLHHSRALRQELYGFGVRGRPAPQRAADLGPETARLARAGRRVEALAAAAALELALLARYAAAVPTLREPNVARTAATVMASHGQHLTVLRRAQGRDPLVPGG